MTTTLDTNVLVRHLTGDSPAQAARATRLLSSSSSLHLADLVVAELVYVLSSVYELERSQIALLVRATLGFESIVVDDLPVLLRAIDAYEQFRLDFADAYLVALAEARGFEVASFDRAIDRVGTVSRREP